MTRKLKIGLIVFALMLFSACSTKCPPARPLRPPAVYLEEVPEPKMAGRTNRALLAWALELRAALRLANSDKAALREWAEIVPAPTSAASH